MMARYMQPTEEAMRLLNPTPTHSPRPRAPLCTADSPSRKVGVGGVFAMISRELALRAAEMLSQEARDIKFDNSMGRRWFLDCETAKAAKRKHDDLMAVVRELRRHAGE